jgi:O-methyltransferase
VIGSKRLKSYLYFALRRRGYELVRRNSAGRADELRDMTEEELTTYQTIKRHTMTSVERVIALLRGVRYVLDNKLGGSFVECGVWRGGSMMGVALTLKRAGVTDRELFLYDTFSGMPTPTSKDRRYDGQTAAELLSSAATHSGILACASLEDVRANLASTGYPMERIHFIQGRVEETIPHTAPADICMLRLDTDWYESTRHELTHLYPRLARNGVLIIDDYGHWRGSREATDEYFRDKPPAPFLNRLDYAGRLAIKP